MATQQKEQKRAKKEVTVAAPKAQAAPPQIPAADDDQFFPTVKARFKARSREDGMVLLNIPVWGWTGDGKTCSLLTVVHYADALQHGLSIAYVTDRDEITKLEGEVDGYQGLNLQALAESTKTRLSDLNETFINEAGWPPGTDQPSSYLFAIRSINSTLGYLVVPDIQGGSFREVDEVARAVLSKAHACVVLVQPDKYMDQDADGKRYREEVRSRLTKCAEAGIPACVMITKSDLFPGQSVADETHNQLTVLVDNHDNFKAAIFRVSVIGMGTEPQMQDGQAKLPKPGERKPDKLVRAFVWVIDQVLEQPAAAIRAKVPELGLQRAQLDAPPASQPIAELRKVGDFSDRPGIAICAISPDTFLFQAPDGALISASLRGGTFTTEAAGSASGMPAPTARTSAFHIAGEVLIAPGQGTDSVWVGAVGDKLAKVTLPIAAVSWAPVNARAIVAIDAAGKLHSLRYEGGKWASVDYLPDFILPSERLACAFIEQNNEVLVMNGTKSEAVQLQAQGKFGDRRRPSIAATYDGDRFVINRIGVFAGTNSAQELFVAGGGKAHSMGATRKEAQPAFAIPTSGRYVARLAPDMRLAVGLVSADQLRVSDAQYSQVLPKDPDSMVWSTDGQLLVVTFADGTYSAFKPSGLRA